ncbi:oligosaccharide flippase family protein, partial [Vibrio sp. V02_P2A34T13]
MLDRGLLRNIALTYSTRLILIALGLICNVFITRSLGVENYGSYVLFITLIATIVQVSNFGIPASNLYLAAKNDDDSSLLISNSLVYS